MPSQTNGRTLSFNTDIADHHSRKSDRQRIHPHMRERPLAWSGIGAGFERRGIFARIPDFEAPTDLIHNRALIADVQTFARDAGATSWLFLCGEAFAAMEGGMLYAHIESAVSEAENSVSDPPRVLDMDIARQHIAALDRLPRPTLVTCRTGPRSSAVV